jgi:hypothetical protein
MRQQVLAQAAAEAELSFLGSEVKRYVGEIHGVTLRCDEATSGDTRDRGAVRGPKRVERQVEPLDVAQRECMTILNSRGACLRVQAVRKGLAQCVNSPARTRARFEDRNRRAAPSPRPDPRVPRRRQLAHGPFPPLEPKVIQADRRASSGGSTCRRVFRRNSEGVQPNARLNASVK